MKMLKISLFTLISTIAFNALAQVAPADATRVVRPIYVLELQKMSHIPESVAKNCRVVEVPPDPRMIKDSAFMIGCAEILTATSSAGAALGVLGVLVGAKAATNKIESMSWYRAWVDGLRNDGESLSLILASMIRHSPGWQMFHQEGSEDNPSEVAADAPPQPIGSSEEEKPQVNRIYPLVPVVTHMPSRGWKEFVDRLR